MKRKWNSSLRQQTIKEQKQNKITQENEQNEINLMEDFSNDDLYGDNGINELEKERYGVSQEKVKSFLGH